MNPSISLLHIAPWVRTIGGVETLMAVHGRMDGPAGFATHNVALFDRPAGVDGKGTALGFSWRSTPSGMRRALREACAPRAGSVVVHHGAWGVPWFGDIDASERRILFLHANISRYFAMLPELAPWADGIACDAESTAQELRRRWPWFDPERVVTPPQPIFPLAITSLDRPARSEWVVGHVGRLQREHKAAHRLVPFVREARRRGLNFRFEIMGDGPLRPYLERKLGSDPGVCFLGWQGGEDYWRYLRSWDSFVSFSDHEGGPITLLEAMSAGVIPFYPRIGGSLGDDYAPLVDARCYYPAGDPLAALTAMAELRGLPPAQLAQLRQRAATAVQAHVGGGFSAVFSALVRRVSAMPRISRPPSGRRPAYFSDHLPIGLITRCLPCALSR